MMKKSEKSILSFTKVTIERLTMTQMIKGGSSALRSPTEINLVTQDIDGCP